MNDNSCNTIQEGIAVGEVLSVDQQNHLNRCLKCQQVLSDYQNLKDLFTLTLAESSTPSHFADAVMARIQNESEPLPIRWLQKMQQFLIGPSSPLQEWSFTSPARITRGFIFVTTLFLFAAAR